MLNTLALLKLIKPKHMIMMYEYVFKKNDLDRAMEDVVKKIERLEHENQKIREKLLVLEIKLK
tara:strand:- start:528 stop:716 length:189 start_codon:yes stop_codon:yes gene_type:complete